MPQMRVVHSIRWRRLDVVGRDVCRLLSMDDGWLLSGLAVFRNDDGVESRLRYRVDCDAQWLSRSATVRGVSGKQAVDLRIRRESSGAWLIDSPSTRLPDSLAHCVDLDLGFTPATNLIPIRRLDLAVGEQAEVHAAWLDVATLGLSELHQTYRRIEATTYHYRAPPCDYDELLEVDPCGFVHRYPHLWQREAAGR